MQNEVRTTCPYCGVGCGIVARRAADGAPVIEGDPDHPASFGRLCSKGAALAETLGPGGRLLHPEVRGERVGWDAALGVVARGLAETRDAHGPDSVAFYVSGQLLTEDYYVANKLMKGFLGSANIDTNSRLCMASSVAGHRRAFGADVVPGCYEDLEQAELVVLVGSNLAWCHPVLFQRIEAAGARCGAPRVVVIDPRRSATAQAADRHLALAPDSDVALFAGLFAHLAGTGTVDADYVAAHTAGYESALAEARRFDPGTVAARTGLARAEILEFYEAFAGAERVVTVYSQGVNQSTQGTDKVNAIINCHLATGRIGRPGMGPFSVTGQPNAMGGREVGGLANQLACHLDLENPEHRSLVRRFWKAPALAERPGLKAVELFEALGAGRVRALWIMGTNPVDSLPDADEARAALARCPLVIVSDVVAVNDTLPHAQIRLPAAAWGEKDGTVTNSERRISRQRRFLPLPGEARPDWWIVAQVARRMGFGAAFDYAGPAEIFREHAELSGLAAALSQRPFDLGALADPGREAYADMAPQQWPLPRGCAGRDPSRLFGDGVFATPDGRARFVPTPGHPREPRADPALRFVLNTGRVRDHWHTLTRTGRSPRLSRHFAEPFAEIAPADAEAHGVRPAGLVRIHNARGSVLARALVTDAAPAGSVFVPIHWTREYASAARVGVLADPRVDPVSGQPGLKHARVALEAVRPAWYGFAIVRERPAELACDYWAIARTRGGLRMELAGLAPLSDPQAFALRLLGDETTSSSELLSYRDPTAQQYRFALLSGRGLLGALFLAPEPVAAARTWLAGLLAEEQIDVGDALTILAGTPGAALPDEGNIVCSCHGIGIRRIAAAIRGGARSVDAVARATSAGSHCGSCRPELARLIASNVFEGVG